MSLSYSSIASSELAFNNINENVEDEGKLKQYVLEKTTNINWRRNKRTRKVNSRNIKCKKINYQGLNKNC